MRTAPVADRPRTTGPGRVLASLSPWLLLAHACTGAIGEPPETLWAPNGAPPSGTRPGGVAPSQAPSGSGAPGQGAPASAEAQAYFPGTTRAPAATRLWRLSWEQYDRSVQRLLGTTATPSTELDPELISEGFKNRARVLAVDERTGTQLLNAAKALASEAGGRLATLLPCPNPDPANAACVRAFVERLGRDAFRRPLSSEERDGYLALHQTVAASFGARTGVESVIEAMLSSPFFLYRFEVGAPDRKQGDSVTLTPHEVAAALSYALWNEPPDGGLSARADDGSLLRPEVLAGEVDRLLQDARSSAGLFSFVSQWLAFSDTARLTKSVQLHPVWNEGVARAVLESSRRFVVEAVKGPASFKALMTASFGHVSPELATLLGIELPGTGFQRVEMDPNRRSGLLTHPAFLASLATETTPSTVARGLHLVEAVLCEHPPPAPDNVNTEIPEEVAREARTKRELLATHASGSECRGCHLSFDPLGLALENYDAVGRWRDTENGVPIDAAGSIVFLEAPSNRFGNAVEMARLLAGQAKVHQCVVRQAFGYVFGRKPEAGDDPALQAAFTTFRTSGLDLRALWRSFLLDPAFVQRRPAAS